MIFKVQIPMATNESIPQALIYNEDRSVRFMCPAEDVEEWFIEDQYKIYVDADYSVVDADYIHKEFAIHEIVMDKDW